MSVSNPEQQPDTSSLGIIVRYMEKTVKLEEERKKDKEELQTQISEVRKETADMVDSRLSAFGERFDSLDKKLEEMTKKEQPTEIEQTQVTPPLSTTQETTLSSPPTEIHPPPVPKGMRGRRKYRKEHKNQ